MNEQMNEQINKLMNQWKNESLTTISSFNTIKQ